MSFAITPVADSALVAVQAATVAWCVQHLSVPVWDYVPETQTYPFVVVGEATEFPHNVHGRFGRRIHQTVHVWTKGRQGFAPGLAIVAELQRLFDHRENDVGPLVDGHRVQSIRYRDARPMGDPDPLIRHIPTTFTWITEQHPPT